MRRPVVPSCPSTKTRYFITAPGSILPLRQTRFRHAAQRCPNAVKSPGAANDQRELRDGDQETWRLRPRPRGSLGPRVKDAGDGRASPRGRALALCSSGNFQPGKYQPRTRMDEGALYELAESIKAQGIMQPVLVRRVVTPMADIRPPATAPTQNCRATR